MNRHAQGNWNCREQCAHPRSSRDAARQRRRVDACRSSAQRNPCYFGEAAGYAGNDSVASSFKYGLRFGVGNFLERFQ